MRPTDAKGAAIRCNALKSEVKTLYFEVMDLVNTGEVDSYLFEDCATDTGDTETQAAQAEREKVYTLLQDAISYVFFKHFPDLRPSDFEPLISSPLDPPEGMDWRDWLIHGRAETPEEQTKIYAIMEQSAAIHNGGAAD